MARILQKRLGLVMAGGGAKGAYAFGWLKAFKERRIDFHVLAGTSVGALNAVLWSSDKIADGEKFWREISFGRVFSAKIPKLAVWLFVGTRFFLDKANESADGRNGIGMILREGVVAGLVLGFLILAVGVLGVLSGAGSSSSGNLVWLLLLLPAILIVVVPAILQGRNIAAHDNQPLVSALESFLKEGRLSVPIYATSAARRRAIHPDLLLKFYSEVDPMPGYMAGSAWIPDYVRLDKSTSVDEIVSATIVSAALPYGIVKHLDGNVDGGLADNVPIWPLLFKESCDEIIVLALDSNPLPVVFPSRGPCGQGVAGLLDYAGRIDELIQSAKLEPEKFVPEGAHLTPDVIPIQTPRFVRPKALHLIVPKQTLGGFFSGTLRFDMSYCARLIDQGYVDAIAWLDTETPE